MSDVLPIRPSQVAANKASVLPAAVIQAFNTLITRAWDGRSAMVYQHQATALMKELDPELTDERIREEHLLDVEVVYRRHGWRVTYEKPAWNESGHPFYTFTEDDS